MLHDQVVPLIRKYSEHRTKNREQILFKITPKKYRLHKKQFLMTLVKLGLSFFVTGLCQRFGKSGSLCTSFYLWILSW